MPTENSSAQSLQSSGLYVQNVATDLKAISEQIRWLAKRIDHTKFSEQDKLALDTFATSTTAQMAALTGLLRHDCLTASSGRRSTALVKKVRRALGYTHP